ncbi:DUF29 domain-containing protein [Candidatus Venteria ishoeyi]|uniref:DUF29 domain-containing protein n=1 Tax=Candidatus Venteria ishoeyi TaxID=1899563 RepID=UPI0025A5F542|nr:DUF29 domain-containing protein [Candidatus Venteria ishoeyi]MDM8545712.1 DUF29 domain-containing protein [Candidatus Venteria ishoeyi]
MTDLSHLYDLNYTEWAMKNAALLKAGRFSELDVPHLLEELEDMGKSDHRELSSRLRVLLAHLLKWQFQYQQLSERWKEFDGRSWRRTIINQRTSIAILLRKKPGLSSFVTEALAEAYPEAVELATKETQLPRTHFPETCPYTQTEILNDDYYP